MVIIRGRAGPKSRKPINFSLRVPPTTATVVRAVDQWATDRGKNEKRRKGNARKRRQRRSGGKKRVVGGTAS